MDIRKATISDSQDIARINETSLGYAYSLENTEKKVSKILQLSGNKIFVACINAQVVGYIHVADYECTYMDSVKNIMAIAVDTAYQGMGIGKQLLEVVENWAKEEGSVGVRLVSGSNRTKAHTFYQKCGYNARKEQKNFIKFF